MTRPLNGGDAGGTGSTPTASDIPSTGPSNVQSDLDALAASLGGLIVIDSVAKLDAEFPDAGGVHTIDKQTIWVSQSGAPFDLTATGRSIEIADPGTMVGLGGLKVLIIGDVAGPLVFGEPVIANMAILNVNPAGTDAAWESLSGRFISILNVALLGQSAGTISNVTGIGRFTGLQLQPAAPGAVGLTVDGVCAVLLWDGAASSAGGAPYTAVSLAATCVIAADFRFTFGFFGGPTDSLLSIPFGATLPTGPLPTSIVGFEVVNCSLKGGPALLAAGGRQAGDIRILSSQNTSGPSSTFIGDAVVDTTGAPSISLDHAGEAGNPLPIPLDNSQNGGAGGTLRSFTLSPSTSRYTLATGLVESATVSVGGTYTGGDGDYPATQASSSGAGTGAAFTVTLSAGTITAVVSVDAGGQDYVIADTITITVVGPTETVAAVLSAASLFEFALRTDGPVDDLSGPVGWSVSYQRGAGGAGSSVFGYLERLKDGVGSWTEVPGTRSVLAVLTGTLTGARGTALLDDIDHADQWRIAWVNDNVGSTETLYATAEIIIEGRS